MTLTTREMEHALAARDFASRARLGGEAGAPATDLAALRDMSREARRALYEHAVRTALGEPSETADDAEVLRLGVEPGAARRLLLHLRRWVVEGPDGLEG